MSRASEADVRRLVARIVDEAVGSPAPSAATDPETIAVGADHGGFRLKGALIEHLRNRGFAVHDCGAASDEASDYPDFAHAVARLVGTGTCRRGIVVDTVGIGSAMVANKVPGVRAGLCYDVSTARSAREHNHANVLTLGAGMIGEPLARQIVDAWLDTGWGPGRHARRVAKITDVEARYLSAGKET